MFAVFFLFERYMIKTACLKDAQSGNSKTIAPTLFLFVYGFVKWTPKRQNQYAIVLSTLHSTSNACARMQESFYGGKGLSIVFDLFTR